MQQRRVTGATPAPENAAPDSIGQAWNRFGAAMLTAFVLAATGCGTNGFAPDALVENPGADAFLNRIQQQCGKLSVGDQPLNYLLSSSSNDTYFVDATSKLYLGTFDKKQYADSINAFYPTGTNQPALDCIFAKLP